MHLEAAQSEYPTTQEHDDHRLFIEHLLAIALQMVQPGQGANSTDTPGQLLPSLQKHPHL